MNELVRPMMVETEDGKRYMLILPSDSVQGVAKSILILNNVKSRNFLTKQEKHALDVMLAIFSHLPLGELDD